MSLAWISLIALLAAIIVSCFSRMNIGVLAVVLAWIVGVYFGGMKVEQVAAGFPSALFLTLTGVTLLFTQAQVNGTLDRVAHHAVAVCRGNTGMIPIMFFITGLALASMGPGNIAATALLAPLAMATAYRAGIPAFLMAMMVGNGANAGALSPFAPTGVIATGLMTKIGLPGHEWQTYWSNVLAHTIVAFAGYLVCGGWRLFRFRYHAVHQGLEEPGFERTHWITLAVIFTLIASVLFFKINVGMGAFACALLLPLLRAADHVEAIRRMPWSVIVLVTGVTVLVSILEKTQGIQLFADLLARFATAGTVTAVVAFVAGLVSVYASTSGVILPTFLPIVPGLAAKFPGASAVAIATAVNVGGHLVDVSPLSTIGALCIAAAPPSVDSTKLFQQMLAWGLAMTLAGTVLCLILFGR